MNKVIGNVAVVTGAAQGVGYATVERLLREGATEVYALDAKPAEAPPGATVIQLDVTDDEAVNRFFTELPNAPQILVNCAGVYAWRDSFSFSTELFSRTLDVNVLGVYRMMRAFSDRLIAEELQGAIVNIASVAGRTAFPHQADYCASKAAVIGLTRAACLDLADHRITVNAIAPGTVDTPMIDQVAKDIAGVSGLSFEEQRVALVQGIPLKRMLQPAELAAAVFFFVSTDAVGITGETMNVDSGTVRN